MPDINGGGLYVEDGALTLTNTRFVENTADVESLAFGFGGGAYAKESNIVADRTTFIRNVGQRGSAVAVEAFADGYTARFVNSLFVGAASNTESPLFYTYRYGLVEILHATFVGPTSSSGVAIHFDNSEGSVINTIASTFATAIKQQEGVVAEDFNLYHTVGSRVDGVAAEGGHSLTGDPRFVGADAGDYQLGSGSAAIDAGTDVGVTHDLVQTVRPQGAKMDIGAYEAMATSGYKTYLPLTQK
jgi:hypothetical protein